MSVSSKVGFSEPKTIKTLNGEKVYKFKLLRRKQAARIYHNTIKALLGALASVAGKDGKKSAESIARAIDGLEFDLVWELAEALLKGAVIQPDPDNLNNVVSITNLSESDYYDEEREELYIALYHALEANYPKSFALARGRLQDTGIDLASLMDTA